MERFRENRHSNPLSMCRILNGAASTCKGLEKRHIRFSRASQAFSMEGVHFKWKFHAGFVEPARRSQVVFTGMGSKECSSSEGFLMVVESWVQGSLAVIPTSFQVIK